MDLMDRMDLIFTLSMKSISAAMEQHCLHRTLWSKNPPFLAFCIAPAVKFRNLAQP